MSNGSTVRRAIVLSGSIGKGHDSVAEACAAALEQAGAAVDIVDCMRLLGQGAAKIGEATFRRLFAHPTLFDSLHFAHLRTGSRLAQAMARASSNRLVPALERMAKGAPVLWVAAFPTGAKAAGTLATRARGDAEGRGRSRAVVVVTDAVAHSVWIHEGVDRYLVSSPTAAATVRAWLPDAAVATIPAPVRPAFFAAPSRAEARRALEVDPDARCVLVMGGGWGLDAVAALTDALSAAGWLVLAVAGQNRRLERRLGELEARRPPGRLGGVKAYGFVEHVPELMAAADVVVTSAGQTCTEARVVGRPLVVLDVVPGHGRENALAEVTSGGALLASPDPARAARVVETALLAGAPPPWPVTSPAEWQARFVAAIDGCWP
jgi:processive 1,2-diacylglycerol beta-glucosyltransferase